MKIENQVCTLEQAKRLQELGIEQSAFISWCEALLGSTEHDEAKSHWLLAKTVGDDGEPSLTDMPDWWDDEDYGYNEVYSAFSVSELGVMLPDGKDIGNLCQVWSYRKLKTLRHEFEEYGCRYYDADLKEIIYKHSGDTEAESRAEMLIHLLETGKITAAECNQRLLAA